MDESKGQTGSTGDTAPGADDAPDRRALLRLGSLGVAAVVTIRPAIAQAAASVVNCQIPVPDNARAGAYIAADGSTVAAGTPGAFPGSGTPLRGEDVKAALGGRSFPGASYEQSQAWTNYIRRLQRGQGGFTCYASLQMPGAFLSKGSVFRAAAPDVLRSVRLDGMSAIYDRRSGQTHVVAEAVPAILDAMGDAMLDAAAIAARLGVSDQTALVAERLDELAAIGLVEMV